MTGCGCLLVVGLIVGLLVVFLFGSTDSGEPVEEVIALAIGAFVPLRARRTLVLSEA